MVKLNSHTRRVDHLCHTFFASAFAEQDAGGRRVSQYMTTNGLAAIGTREESAGTRVGLDLVDDQDGDVELL